MNIKVQEFFTEIEKQEVICLIFGLLDCIYHSDIIEHLLQYTQPVLIFPFEKLNSIIQVKQKTTNNLSYIGVKELWHNLYKHYEHEKAGSPLSYRVLWE